jgi:hypothetical protein
MHRFNHLLTHSLSGVLLAFSTAFFALQGHGIGQMFCRFRTSTMALREDVLLCGKHGSSVVQRWLDARNIGFDREAWKAQCMAELELRPPKSMTQAHLIIKSFLGRGPADPYTRFVLPEDFQALKQYDISGVGLNLSSLCEYVAKVGPLMRPTGTPTSDGVYVVGTIKVVLHTPHARSRLILLQHSIPCTAAGGSPGIEAEQRFRGRPSSFLVE